MKHFLYPVILIVSLGRMFGQDYKQLQKQLEEISIKDQEYRSQSDSIRNRFGPESVQYKELWQIQHFNDSVNRISVIDIIDKYGWIGPNEIGNEANYALFSVIMHADIKTQEKYILIIRKAVKENKADGQSLAMLEDRIALRQGKKQIYGTQIRQDEKTNEYYFAPIEDPDNIDKRRKALGMGPLAEAYNTKHYHIVWDPKTYKPRE
jgi:hypothetical protein